MSKKKVFIIIENLTFRNKRKMLLLKVRDFLRISDILEWEADL